MATAEVESYTSAEFKEGKIKSSYPLKKSFSQRLTREKQRSNKLYRTPPTPTLTEKLDLEKSFTLDCIALSNISNDYIKANPKLGSAIPPYNSLNDKAVAGYMKNKGLKDLLRRTDQLDNSESIAGKLHDKFYKEGPGFQYLNARNKAGNGHHPENVEGHRRYLGEQVRVLTSYNNMYGFRRNIPKLRVEPPSTFHVDPRWYERMKRNYIPHFNDAEFLEHFRNMYVIGYPFHDNNYNNFHPMVKYTITVKTGSKSPEFYNGNLGINIIAKHFDTGFIKLDESIIKEKNHNKEKKLFQKGQTDVFEFEDQDIRTISAIILSKDIKGEHVLYIEYVQVDLFKGNEMQSYRFPFEGWLRSAKQDTKAEDLKAKFGKKNSIITFPNTRPKYEYTIKVSPPITISTQYNIEIDYAIKEKNALSEYEIEFLNELPENGKLMIRLVGVLGESEIISFSSRTKSVDEDNKFLFRFTNKEIGEIKHVLLTYDERTKSNDYFFKGFKLTDSDGLTYLFKLEENLVSNKSKLIISKLEASSSKKDEVNDPDGALYIKLNGKTKSTKQFELKNMKEKNGSIYTFTKSEAKIGHILNVQFKYEGDPEKLCIIKSIKITSNKGHDYSVEKPIILKHNQETSIRNRTSNENSSLAADNGEKRKISMQLFGGKKKTEIFKLKNSSSFDDENVDIFYKTDYDLGKIERVYLKYEDEQSNNTISVNCVELVDPRGNNYKFIMDMSLKPGEDALWPKKTNDDSNEKTEKESKKDQAKSMELPKNENSQKPKSPLKTSSKDSNNNEEE